jgi:hypothetical protein
MALRWPELRSWWRLSVPRQRVCSIQAASEMGGVRDVHNDTVFGGTGSRRNGYLVEIDRVRTDRTSGKFYLRGTSS